MACSNSNCRIFVVDVDLLLSQAAGNPCRAVHSSRADDGRRHNGTTAVIELRIGTFMQIRKILLAFCCYNFMIYNAYYYDLWAFI